MTFYRALFFDNKGEYVGKCRFNGKKSDFKYKNKRYTHDKRNLSYLKEDFYFILFKRRTYFYYIDNPNPMRFDKKINQNEINSEQLNILLETDFIKKLNAIAKEGLFANLNPKVIMIGIVLLVVGVYVLKGGKLF